tara:strand:+ start:841 stop:2268 length:1428 start_codon:yes stop_codon:yes gene_type:complete
MKSSSNPLALIAFVGFLLLAACSDSDSNSAVVSTPARSEPPDDALGLFGAVLDASSFAGAPIALPAEAFLQPPNPPVLPSSVMLTNLPPVGMQGTAQHLGAPGSCEAWSFGYGLGSYTAAQLPAGGVRWSPAQTSYQVSPAWLYMWQLNGTCPGDTEALPYLSRLVAYGAPSMSDVAYEPDCQYLESINLSTSYPDSGNFMIGSYATLQIDPGSATQIDQIKQYLANNQVVAFTGLVLEDYAAGPVLKDGVIYSDAVVPDSGHGQILVGYNDNLGDSESPGAFLVQNSFGTDWPPSAEDDSNAAPPGMIWWSYNTFLQTQKYAAVAYPRNTATPSGTLLTGSSGAPVASIVRVWQWSAASSADTALILSHAFAEPVMLDTITLTGPAASAVTISVAYGEYISTGSTYIQRSDSMQFLSGNWSIQLAGSLVDGTAVTYSGSVSVSEASPQSLPAAAVATDTPLVGPTGAAATMTAP